VTRLRFANRANRFLSWGCNRNAHRIFGVVFICIAFASTAIAFFPPKKTRSQSAFYLPPKRVRRLYGDCVMFCNLFHKLLDGLVYTGMLMSTVFTVQSTNQKNV